MYGRFGGVGGGVGSGDCGNIGLEHVLDGIGGGGVAGRGGVLGGGGVPGNGEDLLGFNPLRL